MSICSAFYFLIPAAGIGTRMQSDIPKQYLKIHDKSILHYVLDVFLSLDHFIGGMIVLHPEDEYWKQAPLIHPKLSMAKGGDSRHQSVLNGCLAIQEQNDQNPWILVHDAARPGISKEMILKLCQTLENDPVGGILALPAVDTVKMINQECQIIQTLNRDYIYLAQTPQMFRLNDLIKALIYCQTHQICVTDESSAIEAIGLNPNIVLGDINNFKITYPDDLAKMANVLTC